MDNSVGKALRIIGFAEIIDLLHRINLKLGKSVIKVKENESIETSDEKEVYSSRKQAYETYKSIMSDKKEM